MAGLGGIRALPEGYIHLQVNHSVHFVDPDTQACTNNVENMWKNAKISYKARCEMQRSLLSSYLRFARIHVETTLWKDCSQCYIGETQRALKLRLREHRANCLNQKQHSAVVDHSAIGHSWGFNRAKIVNTQSNTIERKIAESLFIKNHSTVDGNKSSFPLAYLNSKLISIIYSFRNFCNKY